MEVKFSAPACPSGIFVLWSKCRLCWSPFDSAPWYLCSEEVLWSPLLEQPVSLVFLMKPWAWQGSSGQKLLLCGLLQCLEGKSEREVAQSCSTLPDPMDCGLPGSSAHGSFRARGLEWVAIAFSGDSVVPFSSRLQSSGPRSPESGRRGRRGLGRPVLSVRRRRRQQSGEGGRRAGITGSGGAGGRGPRAARAGGALVNWGALVERGAGRWGGGVH